MQVDTNQRNNFNPYASQGLQQQPLSSRNGYQAQPNRTLNLNNRRKSKVQLKQDEEKRLTKAYRLIYKNDGVKLSDDALNACERLKIRPDDLLISNIEWFQSRAERTEPNALVETRFQHYQQKRKNHLLKIAEHIQEKKKTSYQNQSQRFGSEAMSPRLHMRMDLQETRHTFSKNFGEFLEKKNAFKDKRHSQFSKTSSHFKSQMTNKPGQSKMQSLEVSTVGGTTDAMDQSSFQGSKFKSMITSPVCNKKPIKVLHLTQPDDKLSRQMFTQAAREKPQHHTFQSSVMGGSAHKPATRSLANANSGSKFFGLGQMGSMAEKAFTEDMQSVNLSKMGGTFNRNTGVGSRLRSTIHVANKEQDRVEKFKKVRENAVQIAIDVQSRHIVRDHKEKQRVKTFKEYQEEQYAQKLKSKLYYDDRESTTIDKFSKSMKVFDQKAYAAYKLRSQEYDQQIHNETVGAHHASVLSHKQLNAHIVAKEQRRQEMIEVLDSEAQDAQNHLSTLEASIQDKARRQQLSCQKTKDKCHLQFTRQAERWDRAVQNNEINQGHNAKKVMDKFSLQKEKNKKLTDLSRDTVLFIQKNKKDHLQEVEIRQKTEKGKYVTKEKQINLRAKTKDKLRQSILADQSLERTKKTELNKLRIEDVVENQDREKLIKNEYKEYILKKEFVQGTINHEQKFQAHKLIHNNKAVNNAIERDLLEHTVPHRIIKQKKTQQVLDEAHSYNMKRMAEYRATGDAKKAEDIQETLRAITEAMGKRKVVQ